MLVDLGRHAEARALLDEVDRRGLLRRAHRYLQVRAKLAMAAGDIEVGVGPGPRSGRSTRDIHSVQSEARARELLGDLLSRTGDYDGSTAELMHAKDLYREKGYRPGVRRVAAKLAEGPTRDP